MAKIDLTSHQTTYQFGELKCGDIFRCAETNEDPDWYMKIEGRDDFKYAAVNLRDGTVYDLESLLDMELEKLTGFIRLSNE